MSDVDYFDEAQWYWAVACGGENLDCLAGIRFVVASGRKLLLTRVRSEIDQQEKCAWLSFGPKDGSATLADCFSVFISAREQYGASYNRVILELAQVPAFANFIHTSPLNLCDFLSNPTNNTPLPREAYNSEVEDLLDQQLSQTLSLNIGKKLRR